MMEKSDKEIMLDILAGAFLESDRLKAVLRKGKTEKRIKLMSAYAYDLSKKFNGAYLSKDKSTALIFWRTGEFKRSFLDYLKYLRLFLRTIQINKFFETLKREKFIENHRPKLDDYVYVWILGSDPDRTSIRGLADIRDVLFSVAKEHDIPILIETTVEKVLKLYKYVGFEVYDEFFDETINGPVWFLKKGNVEKGTYE